MEILRRPLAIVLGLTALAVLAHFVFTPFYDDAIEIHDIWNVLNWFMAFGAIVALAVTFLAKRDAGTEGCDVRTYIGVNAGFYAAAALAILFFWNWFNELAVGGGSEGQVNSNFWVVIDTLYVILIARVSIRLWRGFDRR